MNDAPTAVLHEGANEEQSKLPGNATYRSSRLINGYHYPQKGHERKRQPRQKTEHSAKLASLVSTNMLQPANTPSQYPISSPFPLAFPRVNNTTSRLTPTIRTKTLDTRYDTLVTGVNSTTARTHPVTTLYMHYEPDIRGAQQHHTT